MEFSNDNADFSHSFISTDRLAPSVKADFESLFKRFHELDSLEFSAFSSVWRFMKMSMISTGRLNDRELRQFHEESLLIIVSYFNPQHTFESKTATFYLLYSFYITQPLIPKSKIRLTLKNWVTLNSFIEEAISKQVHDVEFIFHKLCAQKAFLYVAPPNEVFQGQCAIDPLEDDDDDDDYMGQFFNENTSALENIFTNDNIEQLSAVHNQYQEMKCILSGIEMPSPDSSVNMLDINTATVIADFMQEFKDESQYHRPKKERHEINRRKKTSKYSSFNFHEDEVRTDEIAGTSSAINSHQEVLSSEDEGNCDVYYQVANENDLIIDENSKDNVKNMNEENMDNQQNWISS